ncbi:ProQ/FinO family protein [Paraburkholderia phenoliruptrix]|uniref:ProQ/FinO family protein n=1 Tax=Paraburkholderia phenoliruptrix TaxID=252970 RepID=UPI001C6E599B|nr:ProQ/FinO family protein [Paraburkholderia phenoliruptrix]MBW9106059.1 ProQ/FinO family protein [Paraburkholderia phenoliruptrix]MBW9130824.1 ProQ/FinO family protein [Paraburkholderia ginsengiterrae]
MGFEQLAELKKQLAAARAQSEPAAKGDGKSGARPEARSEARRDARSDGRPAAKSSPPRKGAGTGSGGKASARPAGKPSQPRRGAPAAAPAADARPVDPVVKSIGRLQKRFPNAFPKNPAPKLPLKVGIFEDLVVHAKELSLTEAELRDAIKTWCRGGRYWKALAEGAVRVDLNGAEAGKVTAQEAAGAQRLLAHRAAKSAKAAAAAASADEQKATPADAQNVSQDAAQHATQAASQDSSEHATQAASRADARADAQADAQAATQTASQPLAQPVAQSGEDGKPQTGAEQSSIDDNAAAQSANLSETAPATPQA